MLLDGKKLLITGVLTDDSIAFAVAKVAQEAGAEILLTGVGRGRAAHRAGGAEAAGDAPDVLELDVNNPDAHRCGVARGDEPMGHASTASPRHRLRAARRPRRQLPEHPVGERGDRLPDLGLLAQGARRWPARADEGGGRGGASVVSLTFDGRFAWPIYDWMGVAKAGLEATTRYLARDLGEHGIRVNTVSAGPIRTMAGKSIPGFDQIAGNWLDRSPLDWSLTDATPVGQMCCFLFSDWARMTSGEMIHVDGGYHAMGADIRGARMEG